MSGTRDDLEVEALVTDRYLDSLLAARARRTEPAAADPALDPNAALAAAALEAQLARVHPSFRFEERLATDLQAAGARQRRFSRPLRPSAIRRLDAPQASAVRVTAAAASPRPSAPVPRPLLIGGAITSAAISIAGAYVAWRRGRPPLDPMVRAVRAAHRTGVARRIPARATRLALSRDGRGR